jgi:large subunit ribosomal protein L32
MPHEPKKRHSRQRQGKRRAGIRLSIPHGVPCPNCGALQEPHMVCNNCGYYKGQQVLVKKNSGQEKRTA